MGKLKIGSKMLCEQLPQTFEGVLKYLKCDDVVLGLKTGEEVCGRILSVKNKYAIFQQEEGQVRFIDFCCICYICISDMEDLIGNLFGCENNYKKY